jgi:hypothetical protein
MNTFVTINIPEGIDVSACVAKENSRYAINGVNFVRPADKGAPLALATDGRCASVTVCGEGAWNADAPHSKIVSADVLPSRKDKFRAVELNGRTERKTKGGLKVADYVEGTFPPIDGVTPKDAELEGYIPIKLNPALLLAVAQAVGAFNPDSYRSEGVILVDPSGRKPSVVVGEHGYGLVMPIAMSPGGNTSPETAAATVKVEAIAKVRAIANRLANVPAKS